MCLIVYSPTGSLFDYETFECAQSVNPDGIGVMSARGMERFLGPGAADEAWCHLHDLEEESVPYGIHFRMATHGDISLENCHPFSAPRSDALVMHNGIIRSTAILATSNRSDTALFVEKFMGSAPGPHQSHHGSYFQRISRLIGYDNSLLVFHSNSSEFTICNEDIGMWMGDHCWLVGLDDADWLPEELQGKRSGAWPECAQGFEVELREYPGWVTRDSHFDTMDD